MNSLHATIEEFAADGYTQIECFCPRCRVIRLRPIGAVQSVKPWRMEEMLGKPLGRRREKEEAPTVTGGAHLVAGLLRVRLGDH